MHLSAGWQKAHWKSRTSLFTFQISVEDSFTAAASRHSPERPEMGQSPQQAVGLFAEI